MRNTLRLAYLLWTLLVCYPNPLVFFRNFLRYYRFPTDPSILESVPFRRPIGERTASTISASDFPSPTGQA